MEQRLDEAREAMSLIAEEAREYRLEMMRLRQLTWMNEYLRRRSDMLVYSLAGSRLGEAMVDMEIEHELGYKTDIDAGLVLDELCLKTQKIREEPCNEIGNNVGKDDRMIMDNDHEIGNITNIQASLVLDEV